MSTTEFLVEELAEAVDSGFDVKALNKIFDKNATMKIIVNDSIETEGNYNSIIDDVSKVITKNKLSVGISVVYDQSKDRIGYGLFSTRFNGMFPLFIGAKHNEYIYSGEYYMDFTITNYFGNPKITYCTNIYKL